jgi:uncharacterized membrane protein
MSFVDKTVEVNADIRAVYALWTAFEDYPRFMTVVDRVDVLEGDKLHWVVVVEEDVVEWDADVVAHTPETRILWRAVDGRETGEVTFDKLAENRTSVHYQLEYEPDAWGADAVAIDRLMAERVATDLEAFKEIVEALS